MAYCIYVLKKKQYTHSKAKYVSWIQTTTTQREREGGEGRLQEMSTR